MSSAAMVPDKIMIQYLPRKRAAVYINGERLGTRNRYAFHAVSIAGLAGKDRIFFDSFLKCPARGPAGSPG
jgi:hypothetical protein